ncbi:MAG: zinc metallopeptidase [Eubacterium sp.]|nr:zinc metallopeptidase [Eubacterium sp.]
MIFLIPAIIFTLIAQARVKSAFNKWSRVDAGTGMTGAEAARQMLDRNGLRDVDIAMVSGSLTDNYDPRSRRLNLSQSVYGSTSVSAVSVACHEAGHAVQHATDYAPLRIRSSIVPVVSFASSFSWILIMVGLLLIASGDAFGAFGDTIFNIGVLAFVLVVVFHLVTLPVEFDASNRAIKNIEASGFVAGDKLSGSKAVLRAAALTYVAALAVSVANLLRVLAIRGRR